MGTISDRDGTQFEGGPTSGSGTTASPSQTNITDSNGNRITHYSYALQSPSDYWVDTLGRTIPGGAYLPGLRGQGLFTPGTATSDFSNCPSGTSSAYLWQPPGYSN